MASNIAAIYDAIAAQSVSDGTNDIAALDADQIPKALHTGQTPVRLLMPLDPQLGETARSDSAWAAQAGSASYYISWTIVDVLYHTPIGQVIGPASLAKVLLAYIADYYDMVSDVAGRLSLPSGSGSDPIVEDIRHLEAMLEFPLGSEHWFYGVRTEWIIRERVC